MAGLTRRPGRRVSLRFKNIMLKSALLSKFRWIAGAVLLLAADLLARWLIAPQELPVGALTALLGGSYLLWLMHRRHALRGGEGA